MSYKQTIPTGVLKAFEGVPPKQRETMLNVREMIFEVASGDPRIGFVEETLRWGEPAYVTKESKTGSTIRIGIEKICREPALFFSCNTTLVEGFRQQFGDLLTYSKNRAVILNNEEMQFATALRMCIAAALTYNVKK